ncbi:Fe(2+) transporter [Boothiomyces macroporosus]|uniref:Fe(2+) transporter n=1 Tax=Boothiomyces macroporosus TaxID=261099 RepID=A0AAD5Y6Y7_9FUNG|nr:Fe(2+) transporter [Boothiomyces macroporosus]
MCQDNEDYESLPTTSLALNMVAGAVAGITEHTVTYPFDVLKTRMQFQHSIYQTVTQSMSRIYTTEGMSSLWRGINSVILGAGPAHALYFGSYELGKKVFRPFDKSEDHHLVHAGAGALATIAHDGFNTPFDVVKQRMQINTQYRGIYDCASSVYRAEGINAFYISFPTTLMMNVPFQMIQFTTYEYMRKKLNPTDSYNPVSHCMSGACAGAAAAFFTNPLDVAKTALQTRGLATGRFRNVTGLLDSFKLIYQRDGMAGFARGTQARMLSHIPSTAVAWTTNIVPHQSHPEIPNAEQNSFSNDQIEMEKEPHVLVKCILQENQDLKISDNQVTVNNKFTFLLDGFITLEELNSFKNAIILESEEFDSTVEILNSSNTLVLRDKPNTKIFCFNNIGGFDLNTLESEFTDYDLSLDRKLELYSLYKSKYSEYNFCITSKEQTLVKLNILPIKHSSCLSILEFMDIYHSDTHDLFLSKLSGILPKNDLVVVLRISQEPYRLSETLHLLEIGQRIRLGYLGFDKLEMHENYGIDTSKYLVGRSSRMSEYFDIPEFPDSLDELHSKILEKVNKNEGHEEEVEHTVNNPLLDPTFMSTDESMEQPLKDTSYPRLLSINQDSVIHDYEPNSEMLLQDVQPKAVISDLKSENERLAYQVQFLKNELLLYKNSVVENALKTTPNSTFDDVSDLTLESTKEQSRLELELALQEMTRVARHYINQSNETSLADQEVLRNAVVIPESEITASELQMQNKNLGIALESKSVSALELESKMRILRDKYNAQEIELEKEMAHSHKQQLKLDRALETIKQLQDQLIIQQNNASISVESVHVPSDLHTPDTSHEMTDFVDLQRNFEEACLEHHINEQQMFIVNQWLIADAMIVSSKYANDIIDFKQLASENSTLVDENQTLSEKVQKLEIQNTHLEQSNSSLSKTVENYKQAYWELKEKEKVMVESRDPISRIPVSRLASGRNSPTLSNVSEDGMSVLTVASAPAYYKTPKMQERIAERVRAFTELSEKLRDSNIPVPKRRERHSVDSGTMAKTQNLVHQKQFQDQLTHEWVSRETDNIADQLYIAKETIQALEKQISSANLEIEELKEAGIKRSTQNTEELHELAKINESNEYRIKDLESQVERLEKELAAEREIKKELEEHLNIFEKEMMAILEKQVISVECQTENVESVNHMSSQAIQVEFEMVGVEVQTDGNDLNAELEKQKLHYQTELQNLSDLEAINKQLLVSANERFALEKTNYQEQILVLTVECDKLRQNVGDLINDRIKLQEKYDILVSKSHQEAKSREIQAVPDEHEDSDQDENHSLLASRQASPLKIPAKEKGENEQLKQLEHRLATSNKLQFELKSRVGDLEEQLCAKSREFEVERQKYIQLNESLKVKNEKLDRKISTVEQNYEKYLEETEPKLKNIKYDLETLREVYRDTKNLLDHAEEKLELLMVENSGLKIKYSELETENSHQTASIIDLNDQLARSKQKAVGLEKDLKNATSSIDSLQLMIASQNYQEQISELKAEIAKRESEYNQAIVMLHWNISQAQTAGISEKTSEEMKQSIPVVELDQSRSISILESMESRDEDSITTLSRVAVDQPLSRELTNTDDRETSYVTADSVILESQLTDLNEQVINLQREIDALNASNSEYHMEIVASHWLLGEVGILNSKAAERQTTITNLKAKFNDISGKLAAKDVDMKVAESIISQKDLALAWAIAQVDIDQNQKESQFEEQNIIALQNERDFALLSSTLFIFVSLIFGTQLGLKDAEKVTLKNLPNITDDPNQILIEQLWEVGEKGILLQRFCEMEQSFKEQSEMFSRELEAKSELAKELNLTTEKYRALEAQHVETRSLETGQSKLLLSVEQYVNLLESKMNTLESTLLEYEILKEKDSLDISTLVNVLEQKVGLDKELYNHLDILERINNVILALDEYKKHHSVELPSQKLDLLHSWYQGDIGILYSRMDEELEKYVNTNEAISSDLTKNVELVESLKTRQAEFSSIHDQLKQDVHLRDNQNFISNAWHQGNVGILNNQRLELQESLETVKMSEENAKKELLAHQNLLKNSAQEINSIQERHFDFVTTRNAMDNQNYISYCWNQANIGILSQQLREIEGDRLLLEKSRNIIATDISQNSNVYQMKLREATDLFSNERDKLLCSNAQKDILNCWNQASIAILQSEIILNSVYVDSHTESSTTTKNLNGEDRSILHPVNSDDYQYYIENAWNYASIQILNEQLKEFSSNYCSLESSIQRVTQELREKDVMLKETDKEKALLKDLHLELASSKEMMMQQILIISTWQQASVQILGSKLAELQSVETRNEPELKSKSSLPSPQNIAVNDANDSTIAIPVREVVHSDLEKAIPQIDNPNVFIERCWFQAEIGILQNEIMNMADMQISRFNMPLDISSVTTSGNVFHEDSSVHSRSLLNFLPEAEPSESNLNSTVKNSGDEVGSVVWEVESGFWRSHQLQSEHKMELQLVNTATLELMQQVDTMRERHQYYVNNEKILKQDIEQLRMELDRIQKEKESATNVNQQYSHDILGMRMEVDNMRMDLGKANTQILKSKKYIRELEGVSKNLRQEMNERAIQQEQSYINWAWIYADLQIQYSSIIGDLQHSNKEHGISVNGKLVQERDISQVGFSAETVAMLKSIDSLDFNINDIKFDEYAEALPQRSLPIQNNDASEKRTMEKFAEYLKLLLDSVVVPPEKKVLLEKLAFKIQEMFHKQAKRLQKKNDIHKRAMAELEALQKLSNNERLEKLLRLYRYYIVQVALDRDRVLNRLKRMNLVQVTQKSTKRTIHKSTSVQYISSARKLISPSTLNLKRYSSLRISGQGTMDKEPLRNSEYSPLSRSMDIPKMTTIPEGKAVDIPPYMTEVQLSDKTKKLQNRVIALQEQVKRDHFIIEQLKADLGYYLPLGNYSAMFAKVRRQVDDQREVIAMLESRIFDLTYSSLGRKHSVASPNSTSQENTHYKRSPQVEHLDHEYDYHAEQIDNQVRMEPKSPFSDSTIKAPKTPTIRDLKTPTIRSVQKKFSEDYILPEIKPVYVKKSEKEEVERSNTVTSFAFTESDWDDVLPTLEYGGIIENKTLYPPKKKGVLKSSREVKEVLPQAEPKPLSVSIPSPPPHEVVPSPTASAITPPVQQDVLSATSTPTMFSDATSLVSLKQNLTKLAQNNRQSSGSTKVDDKAGIKFQERPNSLNRNGVIINESLHRVNESLQRRHNLMSQKYRSSFPSDKNIPPQTPGKSPTDARLSNNPQKSKLIRKYSFE